MPGTSRRSASASLGEEIWRVHVNHVWWSCELRFHGESYGWEAQILRDGDLSFSQRWLLRDLAVQWADEQRRLKERGFQN
jgi:hypothetical protein